MYARVAINAPVESLYDYHIPPELEGKLQPGHLVQVPFGTAAQHGLVVALHDETPIRRTKPVSARLDPRPALTETQIDLALWISKKYLAPLGPCLWLFLPPGITGGRDILVTLRNRDATPADDLEAELLALLNRRGPLRGQQLNTALPGKPWRAAVDALARAGIVEKESILTPPRVRPKTARTVTLAIHPRDIENALQALVRPSRRADLLEMVVKFNGSLLRAPNNRQAANTLIEAGLLTLSPDETLSLAIPPDQALQMLGELRKVDRPRRILRLLAAENGPVDVSRVYAETGATPADLKRLAEEDLILFGEEPAWRDSLSDRDFVPAQPPALTPEQQAAWEPIEQAIIARGRKPPTPPPAPPRIRRGEKEQGSQSENYRVWSTSSNLWEKIKPLSRQKRLEPTPAEEKLWASLRDKNLRGYKFRRQHAIDRFIVDFYCAEARLIVEVDGEIHEYTREEDALRQAFLEELGYRVIRFTNAEVFGSLDDVLERINAALEVSPPRIRGGEQGVGSNSASPNHVCFLLHGVTGSGKTEIYLRAIEATLAQGRDAIFLVPEIALTAQTVRRVASRFIGQVAVVHSGLTPGERYDTWRRARDGLIRVVVGARSALFTPLRDLGLVILDEEHDHSYKQSESGVGVPPPYYHARQVAEEMMRRNNGVLIVGSATPDLETSFRARRGDIRLLRMPSRIMGHRARIQEQAEREGVTPRYRPGSTDEALTIDLPPVQIVDMRRELKTGNTSIFSRALHAAIGDVLRRGEQCILFINRRGQSTYVFCRDCGYVAACPRCDSPLTHHRQGQALRCHRCGFEQPEPQVCPRCGSARIKFFGAGTQQVEQALHEAFPNARTVRWDSDTADTPQAHETILQRFIDRQADIIVGTQMIAKGLDLPLVTLVGVVSADLGLALPDFRATERTFQTLTQVAGRAGRGLLGGQVILQTYQPAHYVIAAASRHDYEAFYQREIAYRREMGYPPFRRFVRIIFRSNIEEKARQEAERAAALLRQRIKTLNLTGTELIGPAPCFFTRINRFYRWHLLLRGPDPTVALEGLSSSRGWFIDVDPADVL